VIAAGQKLKSKNIVLNRFLRGCSGEDFVKEKGPLYIVPWRCTFSCDRSCAHCASALKPAFPDEVDTTGAIRIVDEAYDFGASFFGITGGEALLRKDLFEIVAYARKTGLNTSIITDGHLLDQDAFGKVVKNEVRVSISIDGAERTNDLIRGKGAYAKTVAVIEQLSRENLLNCLVYTLANFNSSITNVNAKDFEHVLALASKYGARWVIFHGFIPYSKDPENLRAAPSAKQYEWAWNKLYDLQSVTRRNHPLMFTIRLMREWRSKEECRTSTTSIITFS
jgi:MoaA/NifB/PqqE/SkfB family radical SAM enzyme